MRNLSDRHRVNVPKPNSHVASIDLVTPNLFGAEGGIARIARAMTLALTRWADVRQLTLDVHTLTDHADTSPMRTYLPEPHRYRAYTGHRSRLGARLLAKLWRPTSGTRLVVMGHPYLATLALAFPPWTRTAVITHGLDVRKRLRVQRRWALRRANAVWPVSHDTATLLAQHGVNSSRVEVVANGLDPFWPLPQSDEPRAKGHLLAVGRLHPGHRYKGFDLIIEALARLSISERPELTIVGDGPDRSYLEGVARRNRVSVRFTGAVDDSALAALYRGARAFVLPSTGEGFGLVYLEAMAFSLPCVAARAGGAPEVVREGETGLLISPGDVEALAEAIICVVGDTGRVLGEAGRRRLEGNFLFTHYQARVHRALERLANVTTGRGPAVRYNPGT